MIDKLAPKTHKNVETAVVLAALFGPIGALYLGWKAALASLIWVATWFLVYQGIGAVILGAVDALPVLNEFGAIASTLVSLLWLVAPAVNAWGALLIARRTHSIIPQAEASTSPDSSENQSELITTDNEQPVTEVSPVASNSKPVNSRSRVVFLVVMVGIVTVTGVISFRLGQGTATQPTSEANQETSVTFKDSECAIVYDSIAEQEPYSNDRQAQAKALVESAVGPDVPGKRVRLIDGESIEYLHYTAITYQEYLALQGWLTQRQSKLNATAAAAAWPLIEDEDLKTVLRDYSKGINTDANWTAFGTICPRVASSQDEYLEYALQEAEKRSRSRNEAVTK